MPCSESVNPEITPDIPPDELELLDDEELPDAVQVDDAELPDVVLNAPAVVLPTD
jgi:hypothetical protein